MTRQDAGQQGFGNHVELTDGMKLREDFQSHKRGLIGDQNGILFSLRDFQDGIAQNACKFGQGVY